MHHFGGEEMQLNIEQRKIVESSPAGHCLIKGVAGSGKTTVSIYRIPFLLNNYCYEQDDAILMLTFNRTLSKYLKYQYDKIDEENKIDFLTLIGASKDKVTIETVDSLIRRYFCRYKNKHNLNLEMTTENSVLYPVINAGILELKKSFPDVYILDQKYAKFLLDEIDWIKSCHYLELEEYQHADRLGRMHRKNLERGPQKLQKNSDTRRAIFELMLYFDQKLREKGLIYIKDAAVLALKEAKEQVEKKYTHIIVDESQDLTRVQLEFISCLYYPKEYSSIMFACDVAQSIYPHSWLVKGRSFTSIGFDMTGKSSVLSKSYRTTTQISQAAYSLIQNDPVLLEDENFVVPSLIDRQGSFPVYRAFSNVPEEAEYIAQELKNHVLKQYELRDIAVIATRRNQLAEIKEYFDKWGICATLAKELDFEENAVKLLTMHSIKGLEFKVVFIIGLNNNIIPYSLYQELEEQQVQETTDRKLLYVGMTRANDLLYMTSSRVPSKFIKEIDPKLLKLSVRSRAHCFYRVSFHDYSFKDKIKDIYSNEEKVRQWFIQELENTYKYPTKLLQIEYPVNSFSKKGAVDLAVCVYGSNETLRPFIFVEVKAYGYDIEEGIAQLKSYLSNDKTCRYGVVTNGCEMVVLNSEFEIIDDIPTFSVKMLPSTGERFDFIHLKHRRTYFIERDINNKKEIEITRGEEKKYITFRETREFTVYGNIAAGQPIYMNSNIEDHFYLPREWYSQNYEYFMLKVQGDSMVEANIEDGDYVVVKKQGKASNWDIVIVSLDDEATLKRFVTMGSTVLLMPANEEYEPIQINSEQAKIMGVVQGIVKKSKKETEEDFR
jgi:DNA helicase-2/ATP-dependent DNA helicase PcrA